MLLREFSLSFIDYQRRRIKTYRFIYLKYLIFIKLYSNSQTYEKYKFSKFEFN